MSQCVAPFALISFIIFYLGVIECSMLYQLFVCFYKNAHIYFSNLRCIELSFIVIYCHLL